MGLKGPRAEEGGTTGRERVARALAFEAPDRPPFQLSFRAAGGASGSAWLAEWPARAGADILEIPCPTAWPKLTFSADKARSAPVAACATLLEADWPDPLDPSLYLGLRRAARSYPDRALFQRVRGLYGQIAAGIGWDLFLTVVARDPRVIGALLERAVTLAATFAGEAMRHGADALVLVEEVPAGVARGETAEVLERWVFPFDRLLLEGPAQAGMPIVAWCPGADAALWERFLFLGARLLGPLPILDGALARLQEKMTDRPGIYGARETGPILAQGQPEAIRRHVCEIAGAAGARAGLILAAPDLPPRTPMGGLEAYIAAVREWRY